MVVVALVVAGLVWWRSSRDYQVPLDGSRAGDGRTLSGEAASRAVDDLVRAIRDDRPDAAAALGADAAAAERLRGVVEAATRARVSDLGARFVELTVEPGAPGRWRAAVQVRYRFDGFDRSSVREETSMELTRGPDGGARIASIGGSGRRTPLWMLEPVTVRRTGTVLVLVAGGAREADRYEALAERAVPTVRAVVPWRGGLVLEVPRSAAQLDHMLAADPGTYQSIAAVTASEDGSVDERSPVRVFVNPQELDRLKPQGAQVVISHEATHAATHAETSLAPLWLVEGFADYVALRDVRLPLSTTAAQIAGEVAKRGLPSTLPDNDAFGTGSSTLGATYEAAWLACRVVADAGGQQGLVRLYRETSRGEPFEQALRRTTGLSAGELTQRWRAELSALPR